MKYLQTQIYFTYISTTNKNKKLYLTKVSMKKLYLQNRGSYDLTEHKKYKIF